MPKPGDTPALRPLREPIYTQDRDGREIVLISLFNQETPARLFKEDFERLIRTGVSDQWFLHHAGVAGYGYVRCYVSHNDRAATVARLITHAGPQQQIRYRDGDVCNLRRDNLAFKRILPKRPKVGTTNAEATNPDF